MPARQVHHYAGVGDYWIILVTRTLGTLLYWMMQADVVVILLNSSNTYTAHRQRIDRATQECAYFGVPHDLQVKVRAAMEYQWRAVMPSRCTILRDETLSPHLRQEVVMHFYGRQLRCTALFAGCSDGCVAAAAFRLESIVVRRFDFIIRRGEVGRELFLMSRGRAAVSASDVVVGSIEEGSFFGETALVSKTSPYRTVDVVALEWCELQTLSREHFNEICRDYPAVLANAEMMMHMLEQEPTLCDVLWSYYLRKKNEIVLESIERKGLHGIAALRSSKVHCANDPSDAQRAPERHDAIHSDTYNRLTQKLKAAVMSGALRNEAMREFREFEAAGGAAAAQPGRYTMVSAPPIVVPPAAASPEADGRAFGSENSTLSEAPPEGAADAPSPAPDDGRRRTRVVL